MTAKHPLLTATLFFLLVFVVGVVGYYVLSPDANLIDAVYMTVITISTVG
ncbi:MAG: ion channel [Flavobacteriaceae bacterium]